MMNRNAQGLPVNIVVMLIIGVIIFGLGIGLFTKISSSSESRIDDLNKRIENDISSLECDGDSWICAPTFSMNSGEDKVLSLYIANHGESSENFEIDINRTDLGGGKKGINSSCGAAVVYYPSSDEMNDYQVRSGASAKIPVQVIASRIKKTPCSLVTTATLSKEGSPGASTFENKTTPVVIRIE